MAKNFAGRVGAIAGGAIVALGLWVGLGGSMGAAPRVPDAVTCLPTCDVDGRHFVVAGNDPTTLSAQSITIGLQYTPGEPVVNFEIFDAGNIENWDTPLQCGAGCPDNGSLPPLIALTLYRDPAGDGTGVIPANVIATWTPGAAPGGLEQGQFPAANNSWVGDTVPHDGAAQGADLNFKYALVISPFDPATNKGWNSFKIRAEGTVTLLGNQIVGFIGAMNPATSDATIIYPNGFPDQTGTPYNGKWVFVTNLPSFLGDVTVFDGDMDFGNAACTYNDTNDPDSDPANPNSVFFPTGVPPFALGSVAAPEGVAVATGNLPCPNPPGGIRTGSPAEDGADGGPFTRVPTTIPAGIGYLLRAPDGQVFLNQNPSGNKEWEQFKIQKVHNAGDIPGGILCPANGFVETPGFTLPDNPDDNLYPASDCRTLSLPGGNWQVELDGMDLANLNFWFFSFKVEPPNDEYSIGRLVWYDANENGVQDLCAGVPCAPELGIANVAYTVYLGPVIDGNIVAVGVTDASGEFFHGFEETPTNPNWPAGDYTVVVDDSNFLPLGPLFNHTSTTGGEVQTVEVGLPECTDTNVPVGCGQPLFDHALFGYVIPEGNIGRNAPTNTTCQDYIGGDIEEENSMMYMQKGNTIANVSPGVIFFYTQVTVGPGQTLSVAQSNTSGSAPLLLHGLQARVYTTTCGNVSASVSQNTTTGLVTFGGLAPGTYVLQLKWSPKSLVGTPVPNPTPSYYSFVAQLNGAPVPETANEPALGLVKK